MGKNDGGPDGLQLLYNQNGHKVLHKNKSLTEGIVRLYLNTFTIVNQIIFSNK